ncbi:MAG: hypothetical protein AAFX99_12735 [Myxococcota bacterium]
MSATFHPKTNCTHFAAPFFNRLQTPTALAVGILVVAACGGGAVEVEGERSRNASSNETRGVPWDSGASSTPCPERQCSDSTPFGLTFVGTGFWDDERPHLGPIVEGGTFDLGVRRTDEARLPSFTVTTSDPSIMTAAVATGP